MLKSSHILWFLGLLCLLLFFGRWWISPVIIGGDWPFFFQEAIRDFAFFPPSWSFVHGNGLGGGIFSYSVDTYLYLTGSFSTVFGIPWSIGAKFFWFLPFVAIAFVSSYKLLRSISRDLELEAVIGAFIYSANTYILMVSIGGQLGLALAYALVPAAILFWLRFLTALIAEAKKEQVFFILSFSLFFALIIAFDIRIAYIVSIAIVCSFFIFISIATKKRNDFIRTIVRGVSYGIGSLAVIILLQAFWIVPVLFLPKISHAQLGIGENVVNSLRFFSFANFSDALSLLHPNWPENIFGKTYFLRVEFLLLPILAFSPLLFFSQLVHLKKPIDIKMAATILSFSFIALIGAFLGKGAREPFSDVYIWLFQNIPGFILFRDPTKWYLLIALAYSVLIPLGLVAISRVLKKSKIVKKYKKSISYVIFACFILYGMFLLRPVIVDPPRGTFQQKSVPVEYSRLKNSLLGDEQFYRTLWVPRQHRYALATRTHPSVEAMPLFNAKNNTELLKELKGPKAEVFLKNAGIKYVIVPYDTEGEIFLYDRKYSEKERQRFEKALDNTSWLEKRQDGVLTIYETAAYNDLFTISSGEFSYFPMGGNYKIAFTTQAPATLTFSQNYSPLWQLTLDTGEVITPTKTQDGFMEFVIPKSGMYTAEVSYGGDIYYIYGRVISGITLFVMIGLFGMLQLKKA